MQSKSVLNRLMCVVALIGVLCLNLDLTAKPAAKAPAKAAGRVRLANPHLHGVRATLNLRRHEGRWVSTYWYNRWAYTAWRGTHWGLGTIRGQVISPAGSPTTGAKVTLRAANGHYFSNASKRHTTHTGSGGTFVMTNVRTGSYRVRADQGSVNGHTPVAVHTGQTATVTVKI